MRGSTPTHTGTGAVRPVRPWLLYNVSVQGYGTEIITAPSRGKALASAWNCDAFSHITYGDFLKIASVRRREAPLEDDGYGYVRRRYDVDPRVGQRVTYIGSASRDGEAGTILYPGRSTASVCVLLDSREYPTSVHPTDLVYGDPRDLPTPSTDAPSGDQPQGGGL